MIVLKRKHHIYKAVCIISLIAMILVGCSGNESSENDKSIEIPTENNTEVEELAEEDIKNDDVKTDAPDSTPNPNAWKFEEKAKGFDYDINNLTYELVWSDEFDYVGKPSPEKWGYDVGGSGWGNNELQYYTAGDNVHVDGEKMIIEARLEEKEGRDVTSTRIITKDKGDWLYGKIEVSAKLPEGLGTWPAIWMLPTDWEYGGWPESGEIDIMEHVGYDPNTIHVNVHTGEYNHMRGTNKGGSMYVDNATTDFNVYAIEWLPDKIRFMINDTEVYVYEPSKLLSVPTYKHWPFDKRHHLLINIAFGGDWGGANGVDYDILPTTMEIDYVRVYQAKEFAQ